MTAEGIIKVAALTGVTLAAFMLLMFLVQLRISANLRNSEGV